MLACSHPSDRALSWIIVSALSLVRLIRLISHLGMPGLKSRADSTPGYVSK
jgi:hypothetical protein